MGGGHESGGYGVRRERIGEELGIFSCCSECGKLLDIDEALRRTQSKFAQGLFIEYRADERGRPGEMTFDEMDAIWDEAKEGP